jgi:hypothetical protein
MVLSDQREQQLRRDAASPLRTVGCRHPADPNLRAPLTDGTEVIRGRRTRIDQRRTKVSVRGTQIEVANSVRTYPHRTAPCHRLSFWRTRRSTMIGTNVRTRA